MLKYIEEGTVNSKMLLLKRIAKTILSLMSLGIVAGAVLGCSNLSNGMGRGAEVGNVSHKSVVVRVAMPGQAQEARSAMPNFATADFVFAGTITESGATPSFKAATYNSTNKTVTFAFDVSTTVRTNYVLGIYAFPKGTALGASTEASAAVLCGTTTITIPANASSLTISDPIAMLPNFSSGKGNVELGITIPTGYTLACACDTAAFSYSSGKITATNIDAGAHTVTFSLQKTGKTTYAWKETIIVYSGLTTDTWNTGATKTITSAQIFSTFYVRGTGGSWISELASISAAGNDETGDGSLAKPYATVQKAIDRIIAINDGNTPFTIYVDGTITAESGKNVAKIETGNKAQKLSIIGLGNTKSVFTGNDASVVIVRANYANNDSTLTMQNIKITGGTSVYGGGIDAGQNDDIATCGGTINLIDCEISGNSAKTGGGISFVAEQAGNATLTLNNCIVTKNTAQYGGGIYAWRGKVALENGTVIGDKSSALTSAVAGNNCGKGSSGIGGNKAVSDDASVIPNGGGITLGKNNKSLEVDSGCYISGNYCDGGTGGGICIQNNTTTTLILNAGAKIQYNSAESGGGIHTTSAITISDGVEIIGNSATNGGGIYSSGTLSITGGKISANTGDLGGGILNLGTIDFTDGTIGGDDTGDANVSPMGGGIANLQTLNIKGGVVKGNIAKNNEVNQGGGIYNIGTITMTSGSISKNSVEGQAASSQGGGIYNAAMSGHYGTVTIKGGTISGNKAGLGAAVFNSGVFEMQGGTIGGDESEDANIAANAGGALYNNSTQDDAVKISGGFIKGNKAALGGAIINYNDVSISGGLFSGNTATASLSNGICNYGTSLTLSGSFQFSDDDDIFLALDEAGTGIRAITIGGEITGTAPVAKIVPYGYGEGIVVLKSDTSSILSAAVPKFTLVQPASGTEWEINTDGKLKKSTNSEEHWITRKLNEAVVAGQTEVDIVITVTDDAEWEDISYAIYYCPATVSINLTIAEGTTVNEIPESAFLACARLKSVVIESTNIKTIGDSAFYSDDLLETIVLPNSLTTIGDMAFFDCVKITSLEIPASVTKIGTFLFFSSTTSSCSPTDFALSSVTFASTSNWWRAENEDLSDGGVVEGGVENSASNAKRFLGTGNNTNYEANNWINKYLYKKVMTLSEIDSVLSQTGEVSIDVQVSSADFNTLKSKINNATATSISLAIHSDDLDSIPNSAFVNNSKIVSLVLPASLESIGEGAFKTCTTLKTVIIPKKVTYIGYTAFSSCNSLSSVVFEDTKNWYSATSATPAYTTPIDVTTPGTNATNLRTLWGAYHLHKKVN